VFAATQRVSSVPGGLAPQTESRAGPALRRTRKLCLELCGHTTEIKAPEGHNELKWEPTQLMYR
jgi:hypothetical protein